MGLRYRVGCSWGHLPTVSQFIASLQSLPEVLSCYWRSSHEALRCFVGGLQTAVPRSVGRDVKVVREGSGVMAGGLVGRR